MELLVNDLSIDGQFHDLCTFRGAISRMMTMRETARQFGRELHCHRNVAHAQVTCEISMQQAIQTFDRDQRISVVQWLTKHGPFWDDERGHSPDDYFECNGTVVTDTAVGEAAWNCLNDIETILVSLTPSKWEFSPVHVDLVADSDEKNSVDVVNHWDPATFKSALEVVPMPIVSWAQLEAAAKSRCSLLTFASNAFEPLNGHPFASSAAQRILFILNTLNRFKSCFEADGQRTTEGHEIYRDFFTGKKGNGGRGALFSDSSDDEKENFKTEMTFAHPTEFNKTIFCSWHGKVQTPQLRVHFSTPVRADESLCVVYVGPKITKR